MGDFKRLTVSCPVCKVTKEIDIPLEVFNKKKLGSVKINVLRGSVCPEHQFLVLTDTKGKLFGYEILDVVLESNEEKYDGKSKPLTLLDMRRFFGTKGLLHLIHANLYGYPILLLYNDPEFLKSIDAIKELVNDLFSESPFKRIPIKFENSSELAIKISKEIEEYLVINELGEVLNVPWKENLNLEAKMLDQALEIINTQEQLFILRSSLNNFINEALYAKELYETIDPLSRDELIKKLNVKFKSVKFSNNRIKRLIGFLERVYLHQKLNNI